jgi:hypothetical protein
VGALKVSVPTFWSLEAPDKRFLPVKRFALWYALMIGLTGCAGSAADRDKLAAQGLTQESAPVKAAAEIIITAPEAKVWNLLTDIKDWPKWQPDISKSSIQSDSAIGRQFSWSTGGMDIHSTIQLLDPKKAICWTGRVWFIHAIHCWTLSALPDGRILVKTRETMDGWLISRFYSSRELLESDQRWMARLKQAAET